jgi:hypothetical protein
MQAVALPITGASALYPRVRPITGDLFLVQHASDRFQIAEALYSGGKPPPWGAATLLAELAGSFQDSGPLYLEDASILATLVGNDSIAKSGMAVLLFDSNRQQQAGTRKVWAITLTDTPPIGPVLVTLPGNAAHDSNIAVAMAASPVRFWWTSDAVPALVDAAAPLARLVTATAMDAFPTDVLLTLEAGCPAPLADTPWVTPLGNRLLFASAPCGAVGSSDTHLFQAPLGSGGKQADNAKLLLTNGGDTTDTTPALTPDQCTLLFSRVDAAGTARIFTAPRD